MKCGHMGLLPKMFNKILLTEMLYYSISYSWFLFCLYGAFACELVVGIEKITYQKMSALI